MPHDHAALTSEVHLLRWIDKNQHKEAAYDFVSFLTGPEGAKIMATVGRQNPTRKATTPKAALQEAQQAVQKDVASLRKKR